MTTWTAIGAIATFLVVFFALYGEKFRSAIWGPKIEIFHENALPYNKEAGHKMDGERVEGLYIRLKIWNKGHSTAHGVYGKLTKIVGGNEMKGFDTFDPTILKWVSTQKCEPINLCPRDEDFLDVLFAPRDATYFKILTVDYSVGSQIKFKMDSDPYKLYISIYSDDAPTESKIYRLTFDEQQYFNCAKFEEI